MYMKYWAAMKAPASTARIELTTIALQKADCLILSSVHRWECIWLKEALDVLITWQRWKKLPQLFLLNNIDRNFRDIVLLWETVVEMIVFVKGMFLSSTFNISAIHMLHTCVWIAYCYFPMEHVSDVRVCAFSFPSSLSLLQLLFLVCRWWFLTIVYHFNILIHYFYKDNYFKDYSKMCSVSKVERLFIPAFYYQIKYDKLIKTILSILI